MTTVTSRIRNGEYPRLCVGCGSHIHDQFILRVAPNLEWHAACLKCCECQMFLDENCTCFVREGKIFCKADYLRLFGTRCEKCHRPFGKSDFVMRARNKIFHMECFRCTACEKQLVPGDEFALRSDGIFCKDDHVQKTAPSPPGLKQEENNNQSDDDVIDDDDSSIKQEEGLDDTKSLKDFSKSNGSSSSSETPDSANGPKQQTRRSRAGRVRTVLTEKQLNLLKSCYSANPRPDALMKEQLVEMTGLSPRVVRVWFQNKRCKDKKKQQLAKQGKDGRKYGYGSMQGIPMIASPPIRPPPEPPMSDVHSYEPPWKALCDFAMQGGIEGRPMSQFQQLMHQMHGAGVIEGYSRNNGPPDGMMYTDSHSPMPPEEFAMQPHGFCEDQVTPVNQCVDQESGYTLTNMDSPMGSEAA